jgi:hypothetical protein
MKMPDWPIVRRFLPKVTFGTLSAAWAGVVSFGNETAFFIVIIITIATALAIILLNKHFTVDSKSLLHIDGKPAQIPYFPNWTKIASKWVLIAIIPIAVIVWFYFWPLLFPLVRIDLFEGSELVSGKGTFFLHIGITPVETKDGKGYEAYRSLKLVLTRVNGARVRVQSVRVIASPFEIAKAINVSATYPENVVGVNKFRATIPKNGGAVICFMHDGDEILEGMISLNDEHNFALIHVDLDGEVDGYYAALLEITVTDEKGQQKRVIRPKQGVIVRVYKTTE